MCFALVFSGKIEKRRKDNGTMVVDFQKNEQGIISININYNITLSKERKLLEINSSPYSNNILILYIDSVSRNNARRLLKRTMTFFEKFMNYNGDYNEKYPTENFHSFQFFKYYSFKGYTPQNYPLIFFGQKKENNFKIHIVKYLKENGYITSNAIDFCNNDPSRIYHNYTLEESFDHKFTICDPNIDSLSINTIRCCYGKPFINYPYEYTEQFWRKYSKNRKYSSIITNDGHEGTLNILKFADDFIYNFLNNLYNDNLLKDTSIFLISDHGASMPSIYYLYDFYYVEKYLPMLYVIINDRKNIKYEEQYKYMNENQQTFITAYDIYNTLGHLILGDKYIFINNKTQENDTLKTEYGTSLFNKINQKDRFPQKYSVLDNIDISICKKY